MGQEIEIESLSPSPLTVSFLAERTVIPAFGIQGGAPGRVGALSINGTAVDPEAPASSA